MRHRFFVPAVLLVSTLALFLPVIGHNFVSWDDGMFIYENPLITSPSPENIFHFWKESYEGLYIPIAATIWSLLAWLSGYMPAKPYGVNPSLFHSASLIVHLLSVFTIFSILKMLLTRGFDGKDNNLDDRDFFQINLSAGAGALIFAIHPLQVETVAWASEIKDLLCGLFSFLAIREYLAFAFASKHEKGSGIKNRHYIVACIMFLLALLAKPAAVIVPLVLLILDYSAVKRSLKDIAVSLAGWFITAALAAVMAKTVQQGVTLLSSTPLWAKPFIAGDALAFYLYKLALPLQLGIDYSRYPGYVMQQWWFYATWIVPVAVAIGIFLIKKREVWLVSFGIFIAALLPVLGFVSFLFQSRSTVADHYLYMPMLGVALAVSWLVFKHHTKTIGMVCALVIILFGLRSATLLPVWKNETKLYLNALKVNPTSNMASFNLGNSFRNSGKFNEAIYYYKKIIEREPLSSNAQSNLGLTLEKMGKLNEAVYHYKKAIAIPPDSAITRNNLGAALTKLGKNEEAVTQLRKAISIRPNYDEAHNNIGVALERIGKPNEAIENYKTALKINPGYGNAHNNLGVALETAGKLDEAIKHYQEALRLMPNDPNSHTNMGIALTKKGEYEKAIPHFRTALRLRPDFAFAKEQLEIAKAKHDP